MPKYGKATHALAFYKHQVIDHLNDAMREFVGRMGWRSLQPQAPAVGATRAFAPATRDS